MRTSRVIPVGWRLAHGLGRNPLLRTSDRIETVVLLLAVAVSLIVVPIAGTIGTAVYDARGRVYAEEAHSRYPVTATVVGESTAAVRENMAATVVQIRWRTEGGEHTDAFALDHAVKTGDLINIWVNGQGNRVRPPTPTSQAGVEGALAGVMVWLGVVVAVSTLFATVRLWLNRLRYAGWDRGIRSLAGNDGGRTNSQP